MSRSLSIALAQLNWLVGDIEGNTERMLNTLHEQRNAGADLVMFSELALSGYPPEDLLYRDDFISAASSNWIVCSRHLLISLYWLGIRGVKVGTYTMRYLCSLMVS